MMIEQDVEFGCYYQAQATVQGTPITMTLPAVGTSASTTTRGLAQKSNAAADVPKKPAYWLISAWQQIVAFGPPDFEFITYAAYLSPGDNIPLLEMLNSAVAQIRGAGLDWSRVQRPVQVVLPALPNSSGETFGSHRYSLDSQHTPAVLISPAALSEKSIPPMWFAWATHLLTHLVLDTYHPVPPYLQDASVRLPWLWMDEAAATRVEFPLYPIAAETLMANNDTLRPRRSRR